jgi:hypothetical protein
MLHFIVVLIRKKTARMRALYNGCFFFSCTNIRFNFMIVRILSLQFDKHNKFEFFALFCVFAPLFVEQCNTFFLSMVFELTAIQFQANK